MAVIYLAGGCFWGTQAYLDAIPGVLTTQVGYANSLVTAPTYEQVCTGTTGAVETVAVDYDPARLSLANLLQLFFEAIDPTLENRQGGDIGTQYRSGIYYSDPSTAEVVGQVMAQEQQRHELVLRTESSPLQNFYPAEAYHQDYLRKHPGGYCHIPHSQLDQVTARAEQLAQTPDYGAAPGIIRID